MCTVTLWASASSSYFAFLSSLRAGRRRSISLNGVPHIASLVVGTENQRRHCSITSESGVIARSLAVASSCVAVFKGRDNLHLTSCQRRQPRRARPILPLLDANTGRMVVLRRRRREAAPTLGRRRRKTHSRFVSDVTAQINSRILVFADVPGWPSVSFLCRPLLPLLFSYRFLC